MIELVVRGKQGKVERWWDTCFYHYGGWAALETCLLEEWGCCMIFSEEDPNMLEKIRFENDSDATRFLLRFS